MKINASLVAAVSIATNIVLAGVVVYPHLYSHRDNPTDLTKSPPDLSAFGSVDFDLSQKPSDWSDVLTGVANTSAFNKTIIIPIDSCYSPDTVQTVVNKVIVLYQCGVPIGAGYIVKMYGSKEIMSELGGETNKKFKVAWVKGVIFTTEYGTPVIQANQEPIFVN